MLGLTSCEDSTAKHICLADDDPPSATIGVAYTFRVSAEVANEPDDNDYDYNFSISDGMLPPGLTTSVSGHYMDVAGTPTSSSNFTFTVRVWSRELREEWEREIETDDGFPTDSNIGWEDEETYTIGVNEQE